MGAYKRKTNHQTWNGANMQLAIEAVRGKVMGLKRAVKQFGVPLHPATKMQESEILRLQQKRVWADSDLFCFFTNDGVRTRCAYQTYGEQAFWFHLVATEETRI